MIILFNFICTTQFIKICMWLDLFCGKRHIEIIKERYPINLVLDVAVLK